MRYFFKAFFRSFFPKVMWIISFTGSELLNSFFYYRKIRNLLHLMGNFEPEDTEEKITHVRVAYANLPPFVHIKYENGQEIIDGFMPPIVRAVTEWMNLTVTWVRQHDNMYGTWNGTQFDGMLQKLFRNEVDFLVNPTIPNNDVFMRAGDYLNPIIYEAFTMLSGKETKQGGLFLYFNVLGPKVWISLGITLILIAFTSSILFLRISDGNDPYHLAVSEYLWMYVALMLRQGVKPKKILQKKFRILSGFERYLLLSWSIGIALLIMTVFQSLLVSQLTIIRRYPVVDSLEEFVRKTRIIGKTPIEIALNLALEDSNIEVYEEAWKKLAPEQDIQANVFSEESFKKVEEGKYCIFHGHLYLRNTLSEYFKEKRRCNFHLSENMFYPFPLLQPVRKTLPRRFKETLNMGITRLVQADISGKWFKPIFEMAGICTSYSESDLKPLSLKNIYGVLVIWGVGMLSAVISVIIENMYFSFSKRKSVKKRKLYFN